MSDDDKRVVNLHVAPDDNELIGYLNQKFFHADAELTEYLQEFNEVIEMTKDNGEPIEFAFARLMNNLGSDQPKAVRMLSAFIWRFTRG